MKRSQFSIKSDFYIVMIPLNIVVTFFSLLGVQMWSPSYCFLVLVTKYFRKRTTCIKPKCIVGSRWISGYAYHGAACIHTNFVISCAYHRLRHFKHACMHKTTRHTHPAFCLVTGIISYFIQKVIFLKYIVTTARKPKSWKKSYLVQTMLPIASKKIFIFEIRFLFLVTK